MTSPLEAAAVRYRIALQQETKASLVVMDLMAQVKAAQNAHGDTMVEVAAAERALTVAARGEVADEEMAS